MKHGHQQSAQKMQPRNKKLKIIQKVIKTSKNI